jgi:tetratricopeptide (TPR) repeat protein
MNLARLILPGLIALALPAGGLMAQAIVLKDGTRMNAGTFAIEDGKIVQEKKTAAGSSKNAVPMDNIDRLEWPEVREVLEAQTLLAEGKTKEALEGLAQAREFFKSFKTVKGSPYNEVAFAQVEALDQAGNFDELIRVLPEVEAMKWDDEHKLKLKLVKLNMQRRTSGDQEGVLGQAQDILKETDDANVCARLWMTIAEIHTKRERWEDALMAYLHVPVFYGSQGSLVPQAELSAARTLAKMERFGDAKGFYQRIMEQYAGSEIATTAKNELGPLGPLENKPDKPPGPAKDSGTKTDSNTESK